MLRALAAAPELGNVQVLDEETTDVEDCLDAAAMPLITVLPGADAVQLRAETLDKVPVAARLAYSATGRRVNDKGLRRSSLVCSLLDLQPGCVDGAHERGGNVAPAECNQTADGPAAAAGSRRGGGAESSAANAAAADESRSAAASALRSEQACAHGSATDSGEADIAADGSAAARHGGDTRPADGAQNEEATGSAARATALDTNEADASMAAASTAPHGVRAERGAEQSGVGGGAAADKQSRDAAAAPWDGSAGHLPCVHNTQQSTQAKRSSNGALFDSSESRAPACADDAKLDQPVRVGVPGYAQVACESQGKTAAASSTCESDASEASGSDQEYVPWYLW